LDTDLAAAVVAADSVRTAAETLAAVGDAAALEETAAGMAAAHVEGGDGVAAAPEEAAGGSAGAATASEPAMEHPPRTVRPMVDRSSLISGSDRAAVDGWGYAF